MPLALVFGGIFPLGCNESQKAGTAPATQLEIAIIGNTEVSITPDEKISYIVVSITNSGASPAQIFTGVQVDPPFTLPSSSVGYQVRIGSSWWECFILNDDVAVEYFLLPGSTESFLVPAYPFNNEAVKQMEKRLLISHFFSAPFTSLPKVP